MLGVGRDQGAVVMPQGAGLFVLGAILGAHLLGVRRSQAAVVVPLGARFSGSLDLGATLGAP